MTKVLKTMMVAALAIPTLSFAETATTTPAKVQQAIGPTTAQVQTGIDGQVTIASPRTGIRYTFNNSNRPIVLQTAALQQPMQRMRTVLLLLTQRCGKSATGETGFIE